MSMNTHDALPGERQQAILALLRENGRVLAAPLALQFGVSEDSIRRDLRELAQRGLCRRVHGGALPAAPSFPPLSERREQHLGRRQTLARLALGRLRHGDVVGLDAGSTNSAIAALLPTDLGLQVVTNAPDIALQLLPREGIEVVLIGGRLDRHAGAALGTQAMESLAGLRLDICFVGTCALDIEGTAWAMDGEEAAFKRALVGCAERVVVVVHNEKLGARGVHRIATRSALDAVLLEVDAPPALVQALRGLPLDVVQPALSPDPAPDPAHSHP